MSDPSDERTYGLPLLITVIALARKCQNHRYESKIFQQRYADDTFFKLPLHWFLTLLFFSVSVCLPPSPSSSACVPVLDRSPLL